MLVCDTIMISGLHAGWTVANRIPSMSTHPNVVIKSGHCMTQLIYFASVLLYMCHLDGKKKKKNVTEQMFL